VGVGDQLVHLVTPGEGVALRAGYPVGERFRRSGEVADGTVQETGTGVRIVVADRDCSINMVHAEGAPQLLGKNIGGVVEGSRAGDHLESNPLIVNLDEEYRSEDNEGAYIPAQDS
jgi:cytochrome c-type biogenesis protein CcmE